MKEKNMTDQDFQRLLTVSEVAELTGLTENALKGQRQRGIGLPYVKIGHFVRYRRDHIARFFNDNTFYPNGEDND